MISRARSLSLPATLLLSLAACGGSPKPPDAPPVPPADTPPVANGPDAAAPVPVAGAAKGQAHTLLMLVTSCWYGGIWSEGEGADTPETRKAASEARCHEATKRALGADEKEKYEQLRAIEANAVEDAGNKIADLAKDDAVDAPRKDALGKLFAAIAAAKKEEMLARRAGERVKRDLDTEPVKLTNDEVASVAPMKTTTALEALLKLDVGDLSAEAHALGVMSAMEHMGVARGLPKHLKIYAAQGSMKLLFNVDAPTLPDDATKPIKPGMWLTYLVSSAKAAGHPVTDAAKTPADKEPLAWAGVLEGLHDKLTPDADKISADTSLKAVVGTVAKRLEHEYNDARNALRSKNAAVPAK